MPFLTEEQWKATIVLALGNDPVLDDDDQWTATWSRRAVMDNVDPSGELRYAYVIRDYLDMLLGPATKDVDTSDGGGQSGQWSQHFDHLVKLGDANTLRLGILLKKLNLTFGLQVVPITTYSLTPVMAGYIDPGSPEYLGDPRYRYAEGRRLGGASL